jgi:hypothetical protein
MSVQDEMAARLAKRKSLPGSLSSPPPSSPSAGGSAPAASALSSAAPKAIVVSPSGDGAAPFASRPSSSSGGLAALNTAAAVSSPTSSEEDPAVRSVKSQWEDFGRKHQDAQASNVFSGAYDPSRRKSLRPGDPGYGRPPEGSLSEARAAKASDWVDNEIEKLLQVIVENGKVGSNGKTCITFGQLFVLYQDISDSLVGIMMRAKKRSRLHYEGDMLWQGQHDDVCITIL